MRAVVITAAPRMGSFDVAADAAPRCAGGSHLIVLRPSGWARVDEPLGPPPCHDATGLVGATRIAGVTLTTEGTPPQPVVTVALGAEARDGEAMKAGAQVVRKCGLDGDALVCREVPAPYAGSFADMAKVADAKTFTAVTVHPPVVPDPEWPELYEPNPLRYPAGTIGAEFFARPIPGAASAPAPVLVHADGRVATTWTRGGDAGDQLMALMGGPKGRAKSTKIADADAWAAGLEGFAPAESIIAGGGAMALSDDGYVPLVTLGPPLDRWMVRASTTKDAALELVPPENDTSYALGTIGCGKSCGRHAEVVHVALVGQDQIAIVVGWVSGGRMEDEQPELGLGVFALPREASARRGATAPPIPGPDITPLGEAGPNEPTGDDRRRFCNEGLRLPDYPACNPETCSCAYQRATSVGGALEAAALLRVDDHNGPRFNDEAKFTSATLLLLKPKDGAWLSTELGRDEVGMHAAPAQSHEVLRVEAATLASGPVLLVEARTGSEDVVETTATTRLTLWTVTGGKPSYTSLTTIYAYQVVKAEEAGEKVETVKWTQGVSIVDGKIVVAEPSGKVDGAVKAGTYTLDELGAQANVERGTLE